MTEREGCALLRGIFGAAGISIEEGFRFSEGGVDISLDGFDPARRIGYEYITTEAGDRDEVTPAIVATLEERMGRGELFVFLIDERDVGGEADLRFAAEGFLQALRLRGKLP